MDSRIKTELDRAGHMMRLQAQQTLEAVTIRVQHELAHHSVDTVLDDIKMRTEDGEKLLDRMKRETKILDLKHRICNGETADEVFKSFESAELLDLILDEIGKKNGIQVVKLSDLASGKVDLGEILGSH